MLSLLFITTIMMILAPPVISHSTNRFQAARDLRVSGVLSGEDYFDSVGGCANYCALLGTGCEAFSTRLYSEDSGEKFRGVKCETAYSNYTGYIETNYGWILWEKKSWTGSSRDPTVVTA